MVYHDDGTGVFFWNDDPSYYIVTPVVDEYQIRPPIDVFRSFSAPIDANANIQVNRKPSYISGYEEWTVMFMSIEENYLGISLTIELPSEWVLEILPQRGFLSMKSALLILDADGKSIGAIGHDTFPEDYEGGITFDSENEVFDLMPIYNRLATGEGHQIYVRSPEYEMVAESENGAVAVSIADYRWRESDELPWRYYTNKVILAHDTLVSEYVIVEIYDDLMSSAQLKDIAVKVKLTLL
ncbi:MAG: hypothetical protein LBC38_03390 [Oscillospiraceae bacterium]|jgi:hypothetical protein|nr:hypothetical protein [Oscillospiraceae bacterium]